MLDLVFDEDIDLCGGRNAVLSEFHGVLWSWAVRPNPSGVDLSEFNHVHLAVSDP